MPHATRCCASSHCNTGSPSLQVPCDPKMLIAPLQPEKLAQFSLTTLERNPRRDLVLEADLGIHISLLDIKRYSVPDNPQPLAPEDAALLAVSCPARSRSFPSVPRTWCRLQTVVTGCCLQIEGCQNCTLALSWNHSVPFTKSAQPHTRVLSVQDDAEAAAPPTVAATAVANTKARERARGARAEVSWLMRTTYISSETLERRAQGAPDKRARAEHNGVNQAELDERAAHLAQVEARPDLCAQYLPYSGVGRWVAILHVAVLRRCERWTEAAAALSKRRRASRRCSGRRYTVEIRSSRQ